MARFTDILKDRNFLFLWLGQIVSNFGDRLTQMALVALVYQRTPGSAMALAKIISFTVIPVFLIGPIAGAWVDRLNRRKIMIICDLLRGILIVGIPFFISLNQILPIYFIVFLAFSISRFFIPSKLALIPDLVSRDKLLMANALSDTTHMIGNVVGLVVAGIIVNIRSIGAVGGFYIDSLTFFISAAFLTMIMERNFVNNLESELQLTGQAFRSSIRRSIFSDIKEGLEYLAGYDQAKFIIKVYLLLMAGIGAISCVIIVFIQEAFGTATRDLGFLGMFLVGGLFLGSLAYSRFCQNVRKRSAILWSFVLTGIALILFAFFVKRHPNLAVAGILSGLIGAAVSPIMASTNTIAHEIVPENMRGRIFSSLEAVIHLAFIMFMFFAAYLAKYVDRSWILIAAGILFAVGGVIGIFGKER